MEIDKELFNIDNYVLFTYGNPAGIIFIASPLPQNIFPAINSKEKINNLSKNNILILKQLKSAVIFRKVTISALYYLKDVNTNFT
jgi:hypothetical protein